MLVCSRCGGKSIQVRAWVDGNTNEYKGDCEDDDGWCNNCQKHVDLIMEEEYKNKTIDLTLESEIWEASDNETGEVLNTFTDYDTAEAWIREKGWNLGDVDFNEENEEEE